MPESGQPQSKLRWVLGSVIALVVLLAAIWFIGRPYYQLELIEHSLNHYDPYAAYSQVVPYLASHPNDGRALHDAAKAARGIGEFAEAEKYLTAAENHSPPNDATRLEWMLLGMAQGDFSADELKVKSMADRNDPDAPAAMMALAQGYYIAFRHREVLEICDRLISKDPNHIQAYLQRAAVHDISRRHELAEKDYREAVDRGPRNALARAMLADFLTRQGKTREAIAQFELAVQGGVKSSKYRLAFSRAVIDAGELDRANQMLEEILKTQPDYADAIVEKARLALRKNQRDEAVNILNRAVQTAPWHRDGWTLLAAIQNELMHTNEAAAAQKRVEELRVEDGRHGVLKLRARDYPMEIPVRWELWNWTLQNGMRDEGITWLTEILRIDPNHAQAHEALANEFEHNGQPRRAKLHRETKKNLFQK